MCMALTSTNRLLDTAQQVGMQFTIGLDLPHAKLFELVLVQ